MARGCTLLLFYILLVNLAVQDYKERKISNRYSIAILCLSFLSMPIFSEITPGMRVAGMLAVSIPMAVLGICFSGSFGGGDVKLAFACGAFLGWRLLIKGMVYAICFAAVYSLWLLFIKKEGKNVQFALGPFLSVGFILSSFAFI